MDFAPGLPIAMFDDAGAKGLRSRPSRPRTRPTEYPDDPLRLETVDSTRMVVLSTEMDDVSPTRIVETPARIRVYTATKVLATRIMFLNRPYLWPNDFRCMEGSAF